MDEIDDETRAEVLREYADELERVGEVSAANYLMGIIKSIDPRPEPGTPVKVWLKDSSQAMGWATCDGLATQCQVKGDGDHWYHGHFIPWDKVEDWRTLWDIVQSRPEG